MSENPKICPILSTAKHMSELIGCNNGAVLCQGEECAWWCEWSKCCALVAIPAEISDRMHDLEVTIGGPQ